MAEQPSRAESVFYRMSSRELFVDFFGSLVPGMVFILVATVVLIWPILSLLTTIQCLSADTVTPDQNGLVNTVGNVLGSFWLETLLFTLMVSYVIGHLFYRQDPKKPDQKSFRFITKNWPHEEIDKWPAKDVKDCEFPYVNLREYLRSRGLDHLARLVPWPNEDARNAQGNKLVQRTKNFINILKIRLGWHYGEKCGAISRNEAHVRLMSSMWYVSCALLIVSLIGSFVGAVNCGIVWPGLSSESEASPALKLAPFALSLLAITGSFCTRRIIERFLHYQRVREIVFVLETAYTAFRSDWSVISDICPDIIPNKLSPKKSSASAKTKRKTKSTQKKKKKKAT